MHFCFHEQIWLNNFPKDFKPAYYRRLCRWHVCPILFTRLSWKVSSNEKEILRKNEFPIKLVDNCIKTFLNKRFLHTPVALTVEKKELFIALPYLGNWSLAIRTQNSINKILPFCQIKVILKFITCLSFKDKVPFNLCSNVVYKFLCGRCNATSYGKTFRHLNIRGGEHADISSLTRITSKAKTTTAIKDHMLFYDHEVSLNDFKILVSSNSEFHLQIKESLLISHDKPELNTNETFLPLYLFDLCILEWLLYLY